MSKTALAAIFASATIGIPVAVVNAEAPAVETVGSVYFEIDNNVYKITMDDYAEYLAYGNPELAILIGSSPVKTVDVNGVTITLDDFAEYKAYGGKLEDIPSKKYDKVSDVIVNDDGTIDVSTVEEFKILSIAAVDDSSVKLSFPSDSAIEESDLKEREITLTGGNEQTLAAEFTSFDEDTKTAVFSLTKGSKLVDATTYTVKGQGFTFTVDNFQARVKAPVATTYKAETTAVTAGESGSVYITAKDQYGDEIEVPTNVKLSGTLNELPLTSSELLYDTVNKSLKITKEISVGDELVINVGGSVLEFTVVEAEASVLKSFKIQAPNTAKSGVDTELKVVARDQYNNPVQPEEGQVRWTINGVIDEDQSDAKYTFNEGAPGKYEVRAFYMLNGKVNTTATITVTVEGANLAALINDADAMEDKGYTTASWTTFSEALDAAKIVAADSKATQNEIDEAITNLANAKSGLVDAKPMITKATIVIGDQEVEFTEVEGATASLDLTGLDSEQTATVATVTASEKSTLTLEYKGKTKDVKLEKGENSLTAQDLLPGLNENTPLTIAFLQSLNEDGALNVTTSLKDYTTEKGQIVAGTLTIEFDSANASAIKAFIKKFDAQAAYADTQTLTDMGPRVTGTQAEKDTIALIEERLNGYGYTVDTQEFNLPSSLEGTLTVDGKELDSTVTGGVPADGPVTAPLFDAGYGNASDFTDDAVGKVALIQRGDGVTFVDKVANAQAGGAVGVIIYNNVDSDSPLKFTAADATIPAFGITQAKGEGLLDYTGDVTLDVAVSETLTSANVIATKLPANGATDADIVYVSAHIDSVPGAPGANDNGAGTAAALELARVIKDAPLDKELRIAFVGAEEIGLVGSKVYADSLTQEELSRSIANFNMDMVATAWGPATAIYTNTVDGKANLVTTTANKVAGIIGTPSELVLYKRGSSDHVSFHDKGIAAANFIRRDPSDASLEPDYHQPGDTMENVSFERLDEIINLVGGSVYDVVRKR